jgi:hypothetical protein
VHVGSTPARTEESMQVYTLWDSQGTSQLRSPCVPVTGAGARQGQITQYDVANKRMDITRSRKIHWHSTQARLPINKQPLAKDHDANPQTGECSRKETKAVSKSSSGIETKAEGPFESWGCDCQTKVGVRLAPKHKYNHDVDHVLLYCTNGPQTSKFRKACRAMTYYDMNGMGKNL